MREDFTSQTWDKRREENEVLDPLDRAWWVDESAPAGARRHDDWDRWIHALSDQLAISYNIQLEENIRSSHHDIVAKDISLYGVHQQLQTPLNISYTSVSCWFLGHSTYFWLYFQHNAKQRKRNTSYSIEGVGQILSIASNVLVVVYIEQERGTAATITEDLGAYPAD